MLRIIVKQGDNIQEQMCNVKDKLKDSKDVLEIKDNAYQ